MSEDYKGKEFGRWQVIDTAPSYVWVSRDGLKSQSHKQLLCQCSCGKIQVVRKQYLLKGTSKSCGCLSRELSKERATDHGKVGTKEYNAWLEMKRRCLNPNFIGYKYYGGRGISIQENWLSSFDDFLSHVGQAPSKKHSLDRVNSNGNYEEGNVKWSLRGEQNKNQRKLRGSSRFKYVHFHKQHKKWVCSLTVEGKSIHLGTFEAEEDAAKVVYKYYYEIFGEWPPYTEKDREVLNL